MLNKILGIFQNDKLTDLIKEKYFLVFKEILIGLNKDDDNSDINKFVKEKIRNLVISSVKQLIYKNVDSKSFKNPILLYDQFNFFL